MRLLPAGVQQQLPVGGSDALEERPHPETGSGPHEGAADRCRPGRRSHTSGRPRHHGAAGWTAVHLIIIIKIPYIYIALFWVLKALYIEGGGISSSTTNLTFTQILLFHCLGSVRVIFLK